MKTNYITIKGTRKSNRPANVSATKIARWGATLYFAGMRDGRPLYVTIPE
jgi:hypothetical protein